MTIWAMKGLPHDKKVILQRGLWYARDNNWGCPGGDGSL
jgi:hypothetical protein